LQKCPGKFTSDLLFELKYLRCLLCSADVPNHSLNVAIDSRRVVCVCVVYKILRFINYLQASVGKVKLVGYLGAPGMCWFIFPWPCSKL
jgi:hypothetical protein